jgi:flagellar hook-basal body complex protein FliE
LELNQVNEDLDQAYASSEDLSMEESRVIQEVTTKYGEGDLDFSTGIYTSKK